MAKNSPKKTDNTVANTDPMQEIDDNVALEDTELTIVDDVDSAEEIELADIPLEEFLKDPQKMSKLTEEAEIEESTNWCPQCSDYTIFVDKVCTVCGFTKGVKKIEDKDDKEESSDISFELMPEDEVVDELGYGFGTDEDGDDY
jgi:ribosomal protein L32